MKDRYSQKGMVAVKIKKPFLAAACAFFLLLAPVRARAESPTLLGEDNRQAVEDTSQPPYSAVCKLLICWRDGSQGEGTGFIYGDSLLATAGHALYDKSPGHDGLPESVTIIPGAVGEEQPFGSYTALPGKNSVFFTPERWRSSQDWRYDYGVISLDSAFDPAAGALLLADEEGCGDAALAEAPLTMLGYDAGSLLPLLAEGTVQQVRGFDLLYDIPILPGQSGAPVLDKEGAVVAIQNYGVSQGRQGRLRWNSGARLGKAASRFLADCRRRAQQMACS